MHPDVKYIYIICFFQFHQNGGVSGREILKVLAARGGAIGVFAFLPAGGQTCC